MESLTGWAERLRWNLTVAEADLIARITEPTGRGCEVSGDHRPPAAPVFS